MKENASAIKRRLKSVQSIGQMTSAMKTVSLSKYNRVLARLKAIRPYSAQCARLLALVGSKDASDGEQGTTYFVAVTANRGLCGSYNIDLWGKLEQTLARQTKPYRLVLCGQWGIDRSRERHLENIDKTFAFHDVPNAAEAAELSAYLEGLWQGCQAGEISFISQAFRNILSQSPQIQRLLPLEQTQGSGEEILCLPDRLSVSKAVAARCMQARVHELLLSAMAGAHGASLMAMRTATDNSENMEQELERKLNHIRQTSVTTQVLELSRGI